MFDTSVDFDEEAPIDLSDASQQVKLARENLRKTLRSLPPWEPDNSVFKGQPDQQTLERLATLRRLREQKSTQN